MKLEDLVITNEVYEVGKRAAMAYVAEVDALDAASDVIHAVVSLDRAAELRSMANQLEVVAREMAAEDDRNIRSSALGEGIRRLRDRADEFDGGAR